MSQTGFRTAARLGLATTVLMFALIVIGSVVRTTGSGLACPDWPLCEGRLIPRADPHVLIEWSHRLVALLVSGLLFATVGWIVARPALRARLGALAILAVGLLLAQILLGALTVWKLLHPAVVSSHLAVALLLFSVLLAITLAAQREADAEAGTTASTSAPRPAGLLPLSALATVLAYGQCLLGGMVSAHGAGTVCPDWPTCNGEWLPPLTGLVGLQMLHRFGGYALTAVLLVLAVRARPAPDAGVRAACSMVLGLTLAQVALGVCGVLLATPVWLSAAHLANAAGILALLVIATFRAASLPAARAVLVPAEAR